MPVKTEWFLKNRDRLAHSSRGWEVQERDIILLLHRMPEREGQAGVCRRAQTQPSSVPSHSWDD